MNSKHRSLQIVGWVSVIAGFGLGLLLIRGFFVGITRGFAAHRSQVFWIVMGYLLFFALAVYIFDVGNRALSIAKEHPRPRARFGWGRILVGVIVLYSSAADHFHLIPAGPFKRLEPANATQAATMETTAAVLALGCVLLIFSGIWKGVRSGHTHV
jgi:hypothetical protein